MNRTEKRQLEKRLPDSLTTSKKEPTKPTSQKQQQPRLPTRFSEKSPMIALRFVK